MNTRIIKWSNLAIAVIFALFAYVQLNDPDPWRWVALYGAVAILYGLAAWGQYLQIAVYFLFAVSIASLLSLLPSFVAWIRDGALLQEYRSCVVVPEVGVFEGHHYTLYASGWCCTNAAIGVQ